MLPEGTVQFFLWDTDAPRLAVRVTAGAKSFIFESKLNRQTVRVAIGDVRAWTLDHQRVSDAGRKPKARARHQNEGEKTLPGILRRLLALPLEQLDADRVCSWLKDEAHRRPTQASLAFRLLRGLLNWCSVRDEYKAQVHTDACASRARDELPKQGVKDDCLQREQLPLWFAPFARSATPLLLLTCKLCC
jgi:hypothetical protein